ncbi:MAG: CobW family GTP-binding protein [Christensenellales bacterium]
MTKVDIFSGFLGAGKTTLIKKLIAEAYKGERLVLIENEFGEIGIDGGFMQDAGIEVTEMNSGCICCSLVGDFGKALRKVVDEYAPDRILIEPSGVGKLSDVIRAVQNVGSDALQLNSFTAVVDANKCKMYMKNFGEFFNDQVEHANAIILSRTGEISPDKLNTDIALLREHNPNASLIVTPWSELTGAQILEAMEKRNTLEAELELLREESRHEHHHHDDDDDEHECCGHHHHDDDDDECCCGHHHHDDDDEHECCGHHHHDGDDGEEHEHHHHHDGGECDDPECECHHHHHHHADEVFTSWGVETPKAFTMDELKADLAALDDGEKYGAVLRAKGIVKGEGCWIHFDYVPGESNIRTGSASVMGRLCVIGSKLNEHELSELFGV